MQGVFPPSGTRAQSRAKAVQKRGPVRVDPAIPMLADDILAAAANSPDIGADSAIERLARAIEQGERFSVAREVMESAAAILRQPLSAQLRALTMCRLPFRGCWFEWTEDGARTGALIGVDSASAQRGFCIAVKHSARGVWICPVVGTFDWREYPEAVPDVTQKPVMSEDAWTEFVANNPGFRGTRREDYSALRARHGIIPHQKASDRLQTLPMEVRLNLADGVGRTMNDVRAIVLLMNSKNLTGLEPQVPAEKLQRARGKSGKAPLLEHTKVYIRLSRILARRTGDAADPRNPMRLHVVRGHFKIRKSGVFWWSPFPRGSLEAGMVGKRTHIIRP